jgi:hypothetical protein
MTLIEAKETAEALYKEIAAYEAKPTKAASKRIRMALGALKKNTSTLRKELVDADKKGY